MNKPRPYGTPKEAATRLVASLGLERAATFVRVSKSTLHRYIDPQHDEQMPIDIAATLEAVARICPVTEWLAANAGMTLLPVGLAPDTPIARDMAKVGEEIGDLFRAFGEAIADGAIDPKEARTMLRETDDALRQLALLRSHLQGAIEDGEKVDGRQ